MKIEISSIDELKEFVRIVKCADSDEALRILTYRLNTSSQSLSEAINSQKEKNNAESRSR